MNRRRLILGYLFGFIMAITLVLLIFILIVKFTVGNKNYVLEIFDKDNYYQKLDDEIKEEMSLYILSSGFTDEIIKDVYEYDSLVSDINNYIDNIYLGNVIEIDTSDIQSNIEENINAFFKENNVTYNNSDLKAFISGLVDIYTDEVNLYHFTDSVIKYVPRILKLVNIGLIVCGVLLVILVLLLIIIKYQYFIATVISSGLIILFIRLFIFERIDVNEILIITEKISEIIRIVLGNLQRMLLFASISLIIFGILIALIKLICKPRKTNDKNIEIL